MAAKFGPDQVVLPAHSSDPTHTDTAGELFFNTAEGIFKYNDGSGWKKVSAVVPTINSISGTIYSGASSSLSITGEGFLTDTCTVTFSATGISNQTVSVTAASDTLISSVSVPSVVYGLSSGVSVEITVTNSDGATSQVSTKTTAAVPTGGNITIVNGWRIHKFTSSGTFTTPLSLTGVQHLVVAGGGSGGSDVGGAGGAGGMIYATGQSYSNGSYTITVGGGGAARIPQDTSSGHSGSNSAIAGKATAIGGGGGGCYSASPGTSGGSGGGASGGSNSGSYGSGTTGQGNRGGTGISTSNPYGAGGGGGAGQVGQNAVSAAKAGGDGGDGISNGITGTATYYAGGGGGGGGSEGGTTNQGVGGLGGGGNGSRRGQSPSFNGSSATGGGGGGTGGWATSGSGGSGVVIIAYQLS